LSLFLVSRQFGSLDRIDCIDHGLATLLDLGLASGNLTGTAIDLALNIIPLAIDAVQSLKQIGRDFDHWFGLGHDENQGCKEEGVRAETRRENIEP
jgi:hypothetical protein